MGANGSLTCQQKSPNPSFNRCALPTGISFDIKAVQPGSGCVWSCDQYVGYCQRYIDVLNLDIRFMDTFNNYLTPYVFIPLGLISTTLLFITLLSPKFSGSAFAYLRVIAFVEILHSFMIMLNYFNPNDMLSGGPYWTITWQNLNKPLVDCSKLFVSSLSVALTSERFTAIVLPTLFSRINTRNYFCGSFLISLLICCMPLIKLADYDWPVYSQFVTSERVGPTNYTTYDIRFTQFGYGKYYDNYVENLILPAVRVIEAVLIISMSTITVVKLWRRQRNLRKIMSEGSLLRELETSKRLARFQLIEATAISIDLILQSAVHFSRNLASTGQSWFDQCTYEAQLISIKWLQVTTGFNHISTISSVSSHFELFFLYLIFNGMFRNAFVDMIRFIFTKITKSAVFKSMNNSVKPATN